MTTEEFKTLNRLLRELRNRYFVFATEARLSRYPVDPDARLHLDTPDEYDSWYALDGVVCYGEDKETYFYVPVEVATATNEQLKVMGRKAREEHFQFLKNQEDRDREEFNKLITKYPHFRESL